MSAAPDALPLPRPVSPVQLDGGTTFALDVRPHQVNGELAEQIELIRRDRPPDVEAKEKRDGLHVTLPMPRRRELDLGFEDTAANGDDPWRHHWGPAVPPPLVACDWGGIGRKRVVFHCADRAWCELVEQVDKDTGEVIWRVRVQAKARELMADGFVVWAERWLGLWTWLLCGHWARPDELSSIGWRPTYVHANRDFVNLDIREGDGHRFLSARKHQRWGDAGKALAAKFSATSRKGCPFTETLGLGRETSDLYLVLYRKGDQLRQEKRVDPRASFYAPTWTAHGWEPDVDGDPSRVEFRARKKGLEFWIGGQRYDLQEEPELLCDAEFVGRMFAGWCWRRRLVVPDNPKVERCSTDPRWQAVLDAGPSVRDMRQVPRQVREMTRVERLAKALRESTLGAVKWAGCSSLAVPRWDEVGDALVAMGRYLQRGRPQELDALPHELDLTAANERAAVAAQFFENEAREHADELAAALNAARGWTLTRADVFELARKTSPGPAGRTSTGATS